MSLAFAMHKSRVLPTFVEALRYFAAASLQLGSSFLNTHAAKSSIKLVTRRPDRCVLTISDSFVLI